MVKLSVEVLKYLTKDDFRVLVAVEMGMKNHDLVPTVLINSLSNLKFGGTYKALTTLHKHKLIYHESKPYDGYRLTYGGYDYLVLKTMVLRGSISALGSQIGVGKESDIYLVINDDQEQMVIKFQRLGRVSFRTVKLNRDYLQHRKSASWLYFSRLAALKEYSYMKVLYDRGFPVPKPIDFNRHAIVMQLISGHPMAQVREIENPGKAYKDCMDLIVKLANHGLIHGDFNEFNLLISPEEEITMIDFPQMVSTDHLNAEEDVQCIVTFFKKRFGYISKYVPRLHVDTKREVDLDKEIEASGFTKEMHCTFDKLFEEQKEDEEGATIESSGTSGNDNEDDGDREDEAKQDVEKEHFEIIPKKAELASPRGDAEEKNGELSQIEAPELVPEDDNSTDDLSPEEKEEQRRLEERERQKHMQKRVQAKIAHSERRKRNAKNQYKNREKRNLRNETRESLDCHI